MAATVQVRRLTGAAANPTSTNITSSSTRAGASDEATNGSPIRVPTSGCNYSYWVSTQLNATVAPDNAINNVKWYTDGTVNFGTGIFAIVCTASGYTQAGGTAGSSGSLLNATNYPNLSGLNNNGATSPAATFTTSCLLAVAGSIGATTGSFGERVVFQLSVDTTAGAGNSSEEQFTFQWDES